MSKPTSLIVLSALAALLVAPQSAARNWSDATGKFNVEAEFDRFEGESAVIKTADGREIVIPIAKLSQADQEHLEKLKEEMKKPAPEPEKTDPKLGVEAGGPVLHPDIEKHIRTYGLEPLKVKPDTPTRAVYMKKQRAWIASKWEVPMAVLAKKAGHGDDLLAFWKRALDYLYQHGSEPGHADLKLEELIAEGTILFEEKKCDDPLFRYCLAELHAIDRGGRIRRLLGPMTSSKYGYSEASCGYLGPAMNVLQGIARCPYFNEIPASLKGQVAFHKAIQLEHRVRHGDMIKSLAQAATHFDEAVKAGEFTAEDDQVYVRFGVWRIRDLFRHRYAGTRVRPGEDIVVQLEKVMSESGPSPWAKKMGEALVQIELGWFDNSNSAQTEKKPGSFLGYGPRMRKAAAAAMEAHKLKPDRPEAAALMIVCTGDGYGVPGDSPWDWFKKATEAELDFEAAGRIAARFHGPRNRDFGRTLAFAFAVAASEEYKSDLCECLFYALEEIGHHLIIPPPAAATISGTPGVIVEIRKRMAFAPGREWDLRRNLSMLALYASFAEKHEIAAEALEKLDGPFHHDARRLMSANGIESLELRAGIVAFNHPEASVKMKEAMQARSEGRATEALTLYEEMVKLTGDHADAVAYMESIRGSLKMEMVLEKTDDWVDIPIEPGFPGWTVMTGNWKVDEPGKMTLTGIGSTTGWIRYDIEPPVNFAIRAVIEIPTKYGNMCFFPGGNRLYHPTNFTNSAGFYIGPTTRGASHAYLTSTGSKYGGGSQFEKRLDWFDPKMVSVEMRAEGTLFTLIVDGKTVFERYNTQSAGLRRHKLGRMQFGNGFIDSGMRQSIKDIQIRSLPDPEAVAARRDFPVGRYVRVEKDIGDRKGDIVILSLAEVQIFDGDKDLATKAKASQSTTFDHDAKFGAYGAIDGDTNGHIADGAAVTATLREDTEPWWEADLGDEMRITKVVVWNRTGGGGDGGFEQRLYDFKVMILDADRKTLWEKRYTKPPRPSLEIDFSDR